jgi:hypothetical protein
MADILFPGMIKPLSEANKHCIALLEEALEQAKEGKIDTIGIVACLTNGMATVMAGRRAADLNMGLDELKAKIMEAVRERG